MRTPDATEKRDLAIIADDQGLTPAQANEKYGWQDIFTRAVAQVSAAYPDTYADAAMYPRADVAAEVKFVGTPPADVAKFFKGMPVPVQITGDQPRSATDIAGATQAVQAIAHEYFGAASVEYDGGRFQVFASPPSAARSAGTSSFEALLTKKGIDPGSVTVTQKEQSGGTAVVVYGGGKLSTCTSGFTVARTSGSQKGILTADHCSNSQDYEGNNVLTYQKSLPINQGDIQYMSSSASVGYSFYNDVNSLSAQDYLGTPVKDMAICVFGRKTNAKKCTTVRSYPLCVDERTNYKGYCNLVNVQSNPIQKGDSGGPWSYGTTVYGVTHGYWYDRGVFTPLYNTIGTLGVKLNRY